MVEGQVAGLLDGEPAGVGGVGAGGGQRLVGHQRQVGHGDDALAGVAVGVAVGGQLLQVAHGQAGLLGQLARGRRPRSSSGRTKPPGSASRPRKGSSPRRTSSTHSSSPRTVSTTRSTVTANGGNAMPPP